MNKMIMTFVFTTLFLTYSAPSISYNESYAFKNECKLALAIYDEYHKHDMHDQIKASSCVSFIKGIINTHNMEFIKSQGAHDISLATHRGYYFCVPKNVNYEMIVKKILEDLQNHPDDLDHSPAEIVIKILNTNYPCKSEEIEKAESSS